MPDRSCHRTHETASARAAGAGLSRRWCRHGAMARAYSQARARAPDGTPGARWGAERRLPHELGPGLVTQSPMRNSRLTLVILASHITAPYGTQERRMPPTAVRHAALF